MEFQNRYTGQAVSREEYPDSSLSDVFSSWNLGRRSLVQLGIIVSCMPARAMADVPGTPFWPALVATLAGSAVTDPQVTLVARDAHNILLTTQPDAMRNQLNAGFQLLRYWGIFSLHMSPFEQLDAEVRAQVAGSWFESAFPLIRTLAAAAKNMVLVAWYDRCESWEEIGYDGPLVGDWQRRADASVLCPGTGLHD